MKKAFLNNAQMQRFRAEAEEAFNNFSGEDDSYAGDDDESFDGDDDESYDGDDEDFYTGTAGLDKIDPNDRVLTFQIENTAIAAGDPSSLVAELFGAYKNLSSLNNGNPTGITVKLLESSYGQFLAETMSNPHLIKGLRYFVQNEIQLSNAMEMIEETSAGTTISKKYQPATKIDPRSFKNNILLDSGFTMPVTGRHALRVPINKGEKVSLIMTISTRVDQAKTLEGKAVLAVSKKKKAKKVKR